MALPGFLCSAGSYPAHHLLPPFPSPPPQLALRYLMAWCSLVAAGTLHYTASIHEALVGAVLAQHGRVRQLSAAQQQRLLATERALPPGCGCALSAWLAALPAEAERCCGAHSTAL